MVDLSGKFAVITGAASGIGRAASLQFAREGAAVVAADWSAEVAGTVEAILAAGGQAQALVGDAADRPL